MLSLIFLLAQTSWARNLVVGLDTEIDRLIPYKVTTPKTFPVSMQIYEGLFDLDEKGAVMPALAHSYQTKDYQHWTFDIRKNVRFHHTSLLKTRPGR